MERVQKKFILHDLQRKMVFLSGPRQSGKTTLAKEISREFKSSIYLSYDHGEDREIIQKEAWLPSVELIILDEIHKMTGWKNFLKGLYDTKKEHQKILVTGSARLEIFNEVGDSLAGRYFLHRLFPLSPVECDRSGVEYTLDRFLQRGGFPEPFLVEDPLEANRWRMQYVDSLLQADVLDFENIHNVRAIRLIFELLRMRVGSPISYSSIGEDVGVSPNTVKKYIQILEALYIIFRVTPFSRNIARSLMKEPKIYFFDGGLVKGSEGVKFENLIALCLLKHVHARIDYLGESNTLCYLQTKEKQEVDFAWIRNDQVETMIEVKMSNHTVGKGLRYFHEKYGMKAVQVVKELRQERIDKGVEIIQGLRFLQGLDL